MYHAWHSRVTNLRTRKLCPITFVWGIEITFSIMQLLKYKMQLVSNPGCYSGLEASDADQKFIRKIEKKPWRDFAHDATPL